MNGHPPRMVHLDWPRGSLSLQSLGAMLGPVAFRLDDGTETSPFHIAPWCDEPEAAALPGLMAGLRGEWPCVPFGAAEPVTGAAEPVTGWEDPFPHGFAANHAWNLDVEADSLRASIAYPLDHPIERLTRRVTPRGLTLALELEVVARRDTCIPIGLHPVFALPERLGAMELSVAASGPVFSHPDDPQPDPCPLVPGAVAADLSRMPLRAGGMVDLTRLPLDGRSESRVLVAGAGGCVELRNRDTRLRTTLRWEAARLPCVMLWISNRGRNHAPWNGRHLALGVEPVCAAFDLGTVRSNRTSELTRRGIPTVVPLRAGEPWRVRYSVEVARL